MFYSKKFIFFVIFLILFPLSAVLSLEQGDIFGRNPITCVFINTLCVKYTTYISTFTLLFVCLGAHFRC